LDYPAVAVGNGVSRGYKLQPLRENGGGLVIYVFFVTRWDIRQYLKHRYMRIKFFHFSQNAGRHIIKAAVAPDIKGINAIFSDMPVDLGVQYRAYLITRIPMTKEAANNRQGKSPPVLTVKIDIISIIYIRTGYVKHISQLNWTELRCLYSTIRREVKLCLKISFIAA